MDDPYGNEDPIPFAKRSRSVHRFLPDPFLSHRASHSPPEERYGPAFWDRLIRQPSVPVMREINDPPGLMCSYPACRSDIDWGSLPAPGLDILPSPSELCGRRKRRNKSGGGSERRVLSVCHHLQELRSKQSRIEQLKAARWGGYEKPEPGAEIRSPHIDGHQTEEATASGGDHSVSFLYSSPKRSMEQVKTPPPRHLCTNAFQQPLLQEVFPWLPRPERSTSCSFESPAADRDKDRETDAPWPFEFLQEE